MPTARPRHTITETDEVARALDDAAKRWPAEGGARGRLLLKLVEEGHSAITGRAADETRRRAAAVRQTSGVLTGSFPDGYLERLRDDWPK